MARDTDERDHPGRPWAGVLQGPPEVTGDQMVAAMDAVGVDGTILVSPFSLYRYDARYRWCESLTDLSHGSEQMPE